MINKENLLIIPSYNCESTILDIINLSNKYINDIVVIDDGSTDNSNKLIKNSNAFLITHEKNRGVGHAIKSGLIFARNNNYKRVILMDADGAHDPTDIPGILSHHLSSKSYMTIGNRWNNNISNNLVSSSKIFANIFASKLVHLISNRKLIDVACGFRVIELNPFIENFSTDYGFIYEMIINTPLNLKISHHPVNVRYDANNLLSTNRKEFENLLNIIINYSKDIKIKNKLNLILNNVENLRTFKVLFNYNQREFPLVIHAIPEYDSFIFQVQNTYYNQKNDKAYIKL